MGQSTTPRQRVLFAVFLLALFPASNALQPRIDEDTWWHLAVGRWIVDHRTVPSEDPFSRIGQEEHIPWVAYSWLHEVGLYEAYRLGGLGGVIAVRHILDSITFLSFAWFILRGAGCRSTAVAALALATGTLVPMMLERPWHYTIVFTVLTLNSVLDLRAGVPARRVWWLIPIYVLWANLHIQFVLGLGLLGLGFGLTAIEQWRRGQSLRPLAGWAWLIVGCFAGTLLNPYHVRLYQVVWEYASQTGAMLVVSELAPPSFTIWYNWLLVAILVCAAGVCVARRFPLFDTTLLIVGAVFSSRMQRDIWFGALMAAAVLTRLRAIGAVFLPSPLLRGRGAGGEGVEARTVTSELSGGSSPKPPHPNPLPRSGGEGAGMRLRRSDGSTKRQSGGLVLATALALLLARVVWQVGPGSGKTIDNTNRAEYPIAAVEFLREHRPPGPLYNHFNWGGHLIWALPEYPVGMDGRTNLYGEERLRRSYQSWAGDEGWERDPDLLAAGVIIAPKKLGNDDVVLTGRLRSAVDRWRLLYEDKTAVVFVPVK